MKSALTVGQVARLAGVTAKTVRFYEAQGLLPPAARAANGYRMYGREVIDVLRFVRQAAGLGLSLSAIREIIAIRRAGRPPCAHVHRLLWAKMRELDRKLRDLLEVRRRVRQRLRAWGRRPAGRAAVCPHLEASAGRLPAAGVASRAPRRAGRAVGRMAALQGGRGCLEPAPGRGKRGAARPAAPGRER